MAPLGATADDPKTASYVNQFCYPPVSSADDDLIAFGVPFEPRSLYLVSAADGVMERLPFKRHVAMPMLDAAFLGQARR